MFLFSVTACAAESGVNTRSASASASACSSVQILVRNEVISDVTTDGANAYWIDDTGIRRVPGIGGAIENLFVDPNVRGYVVTDDTLYYTRVRDRTLGPAELWSSPLAGGTDPQLLVQVSDAKQLATSSTDLYWRTGIYGVAMPRAGGATRIVHAFNGFDAVPQAGYRVDDTSYYYETRVSGQSSLQALDFGPRRIRRIAGPTVADPYFQADDQALYWVTRVDGNSQLERAPKNGDPATVIASSARRIGPVASNGATVVWQDWESVWDPDRGDYVFHGTLFAAPITGGGAQQLTDCTGDGAYTLALDATQLYWANACQDCAGPETDLMTLPLP